MSGLASIESSDTTFPRNCFVYFIGTADTVKIGVTTSLSHRLRTIQLSSPVHVELLAQVRGGLATEQGFHAEFAPDRLHGEWFRRSPEINARLHELNR